MVQQCANFLVTFDVLSFFNSNVLGKEKSDKIHQSTGSFFYEPSRVTKLQSGWGPRKGHLYQPTKVPVGVTVIMKVGRAGKKNNHDFIVSFTYGPNVKDIVLALPYLNETFIGLQTI